MQNVDIQRRGRNNWFVRWEESGNMIFQYFNTAELIAFLAKASCNDKETYIRVQHRNEHGELSTKSYYYKCRFPVKVGDIVVCDNSCGLTANVVMAVYHNNVPYPAHKHVLAVLDKSILEHSEWHDGISKARKAIIATGDSELLRFFNARYPEKD